MCLAVRWATEGKQQGHTEDRFATEGVSQTCPILARGEEPGIGCGPALTRTDGALCTVPNLANPSG